MLLLEPAENEGILSVLQQGVPRMSWQCTKNPFLCLQAYHLLLSVYPTSVFYWKRQWKMVSGSPSACYSHSYFCHLLKILPFFFFKAASAPQNNSPLMILHQFVELFSSSPTVSEQCKTWIWMLSHRMGMQAQEHRCCLFHFLYNLLREWCLKVLSSLELVII